MSEQDSEGKHSKNGDKAAFEELKTEDFTKFMKYVELQEVLVQKFKKYPQLDTLLKVFSTSKCKKEIFDVSRAKRPLSED